MLVSASFDAHFTSVKGSELVAYPDVTSEPLYWMQWRGVTWQGVQSSTAVLHLIIELHSHTPHFSVIMIVTSVFIKYNKDQLLLICCSDNTARCFFKRRVAAEMQVYLQCYIETLSDYSCSEWITTTVVAVQFIHNTERRAREVTK